MLTPNYGISESMVPLWRRDQGVLFNELKTSARQKTIDRYIPKYPELNQQLFEWFTEQRSQGENSFVMSVLFFGWNQNEMNLSRNFLTTSVVSRVSHFNSLVGTNTSDWLESCGVKTMLSKQSLYSARSIYIFHSELNVIACDCREGINVTSESEGTSKWSKASLGWYQNWKRRHSVSLQTKTTLAQRLPDDLGNKILQFHCFVIAAKQRMQYPLAKIFNVDETPMRFELPSSRTLESKTKLQYIHSLSLYVNKCQFPNVGGSFV